jgi:transposase InsO family protein
LSQAHESVPSLSTIHRVLRRRGFVLDQPQKRPRSSWIRFQADLPNECWQSDMTHWHAGGDKVEILHFIDDCSRAVLSSKVLDTATALDTIELFYATAATWGLPASVLSDNGAIYTAAYSGAATGLEIDLAALGIRFKHGKPYHPQTQGKIERYHQTLKKWLSANDEFDSREALQRGVDFFANYYNEIRPHQAHGRPPLAIYNERDKAAPSIDGQAVSPTTKVRRDRVDSNGTVTLRHRSKLHHIGVGRAHGHERVLMLVADLDVRVLDTEGIVLRHLTLDPSRDYQPIR